MKKYLSILGLILFHLVLTGQNNFFLNEDCTLDGEIRNINEIFRFEILDSLSHFPIKNAKIILTNEYDHNIFSIHTNENGLAVAIFCFDRNYGTFHGGKLKIIAKDYYSFEMNMSQWDYRYKKGFGFGVDDVDIAQINIEQLLGYVFSKKIYLGGEGSFFLINIKLLEIPNKIEIE